MNITSARNYVDIIYPSVIEYFGYSKFHLTTPYVVYLSSKDTNVELSDNDPYGEYCSLFNEILLYPETYYSEKQLLKTLIHEYIHYLQSPGWMTRYYNIGYSYVDHPYEIEARIAEKQYKIFLNQ